MAGSPSRVGVLGGTFDPIHLGHLAAAVEVAAVLSLDRVLVVPAAEQPFKAGHEVADAFHRLAMVDLAIADEPLLEASSVDLERGAPTYTIDTLTELQGANPGAEWYFISGADALARLRDWRKVDRLLTLATFVGVTRPGFPLVSPDPAVVLVEVPGMAVSSTDVRRRVSTGQPFRYLVPARVADYIDEHHLYRGGPNA